MIQDIKEHFDNAYFPHQPTDDDYAICFNNGEILFALDGDVISFPTVKEVEAISYYLFSVGDKRFFLAKSKQFENFSYNPLYSLRAYSNQTLAFAGVTASHINNWYNDNAFCGRCGKPMHHSENERAMVCSCGNTVYPKISPAVIVAVTSNDRLCMTKYNRGYAHWALIAGFNEIGETIEQTVHREVMEEVGLRVKNLKYYKSQPWGFSSTLLYGFTCEVDGDDTITLDNEELKAGQWFKRDEIDFENDGLSLTREMISNFKKGLV